MKSEAWSLEEIRNQVMSITKGEEPYLEPFLHGTMSLSNPGEHEHKDILHCTRVS